MNRTRQEFIDLHFHELSGYVLDAALESRRGADLSFWLKMIQAKLRDRLGKAYDDLAPKSELKLAANGSATPTPTRKG